MGITGFVDPPKHLPNSILNLSNTGGGGRGSDRGNLVGDVILHGKRKYWKRGKDYHYHTTLVAGEPTLEAQLMLLLMRTWSGTEEDAGSGAGSAPLDAFRDAYVEFMTTPGSHNDTYANAGGENVARGACLGACLGAYHGFPAWPDSLVSGLVLPSGSDATLQSWAL